ncbi:adenosylhomocysteinase [Micromonospora haikouensis]|uniref:Adenosylhomocysteinase n=1 Tax=Micromonospora haikouensis TaxID=686309 RepID=A0A1C4XDN3_9ACTN|nr:cupin domain-containing protein [Micromonospora haikouensis]SCF06618.1 adenosylhomocysteinase [Micromonospora haikouensis]
MPTSFADRLHWVRTTMPVTSRVIAELGDRPGADRTFCYRGHLTLNSMPVFEWLAASGIKLTIASCDPNTADPEVVARLRAAGCAVLTDEDELEQAVRLRPELVFDTGGDLTAALIEEGTPPLAAVESTSTGLWRLGKLPDVPMPMLEWARIPLKEKVEHRFHVAAGVWSAIAWLTGLSIEGRRVLVLGYGEVGKGVADRARRLGALVTVAEPEPARALDARLHGHETVPTALAAAHTAEIVVTATGRPASVSAAVLDRLPHGAIVANAGHSPQEIDLAHLADRGMAHPLRPGLVEYRGPQRTVVVLGGGSPVNLTVDNTFGDDLWDLFAGVTALSCAWLLTGEWAAEPPGIRPLPALMQRRIAELYLSPPPRPAHVGAIQRVDAAEAGGHVLQELAGPQCAAYQQHHTLACSTLAPGARIAVHHHERTEETYIVLDGEVTVTLDGVEHLVATGGVVTIPPPIRHGVLAGEQGARLLAVSTPPWQPDDHHEQPS